MTERGLSQAVHLKAEPDALPRVAAPEPSPEGDRDAGEGSGARKA